MTKKTWEGAALDENTRHVVCCRGAAAKPTEGRPGRGTSSPWAKPHRVPQYERTGCDETPDRVCAATAATTLPGSVTARVDCCVFSPVLAANWL